MATGTESNFVRSIVEMGRMLGLGTIAEVDDGTAARCGRVCHTVL